MQEFRCAARPEEVGIPSRGIARCLSELRRAKIPVHGFIVVRHGAIAAEYYAKPYDQDTLHRFYSVTKSLNSLAVGLLADDGLIGLDDPIVKYYPEVVPEDASEWLKKTTIRHMLMMSSCHKATTYKLDLTKNWVNSFFTVPADHEPGTLFSYDTSSSHTLCGLVEKLTGKRMLDFLKERALREIGFSEESYTLTDPFGSTVAGGGLMAKPRDIARLGQLLLQKGAWNGKQLLPAWYIEEAGANQIPTVNRAETIDQAQGYGYQFWRIREDGFAGWGMAGQWMMIFPKYDMVVVTTADVGKIQGGNQLIIDSVIHNILPICDCAGGERDEETDQIIDTMENSPLSLLSASEEFREAGAESDLSSGVLGPVAGEGVWMRLPEGSAIHTVGITCGGEEGFFYYETDRMRRIRFGTDRLVTDHLSEDGDLYAASACRFGEDRIFLKISILGVEVSTIRIELTVRDSSCSVCMDNTTEMGPTKVFDGFLTGERIDSPL